MAAEAPALPALPVLDLSDLDAGPSAASAFRSALLAATHSVGFFYLRGTGLPATLEARMLSAARSFFSLPGSAKAAVANTTSAQFRGYTALGGERTRGEADLREQLDICPEARALSPAELDGKAAFWRLVGPNLWPEGLPDLQRVVHEWEAHCEQISRRLLAAWALALGEDEDFFDASFTEPFSLLKIVRYPPTTKPGQGVGSHKDAGVLTLLWIDGSGGLQVERGGEWVDVPPLPGAFVVNIGEMLEYATQGFLKATQHRVALNEGTGDRISVPYFFNPALDARLPIMRRAGDGVSTDPDNPIHSLYGDNCLKSRLRSHPDVAERFHRDLVGLAPLATA